ncbi:ABC transporter ATP-binding protein [Desulfosarcina ovata subsp. sediminis]|uniref:ABC transporter ATP-binding protein n=1 Tax=Desulfosarcina ovata subsp. sediminis TaxID=885957 RepID=A0A5K7ZIA0_9BACT|nr:ABC transporter ATP-binding protein [Desulfosarcina ovata]BBO80726.1 ABC transporter ATP-binding protein [Desulfosarcina ovata subsp. sediminis]
MIHLETVSRVFPVGSEQVHALARVSLQVDKGEYLSIMGPSGSGKSTLLNILGLLDRPDEGRYRIDGQDTTDLSDNRQARLRRYRIGFIFQFFHLVPRLTAADNVALPLVLAGISVRERRSRVEAALARFGIANRAGHRPDQLSGGQRQRVAIARAVIMNPAIILADEPTGNLDRASGGEIIQAIESLRGEGMTVLIVTHDPQIGDRADRCIRMVDGRIVADDRRKG